MPDIRVKLKQQERDELAAKMAEWEEIHGPVVCDELRESVHAMTPEEKALAQGRANVNAKRKRMAIKGKRARDASS